MVVERWRQSSQADLVEHIVDRYHDTLRRDVPVLIAAAQHVERVHPDAPTGLASVLEEFWSEIEQHMLKEEQILFPLLARGARGSQVHMPVRVMEHEHEEHAIYLARFRELTSDFTPPPHACGTWRALYSGLETVVQDLLQHIDLENNVVFLRAITTR